MAKKTDSDNDNGIIRAVQRTEEEASGCHAAVQTEQFL